jgi:hypothetical protein
MRNVKDFPLIDHDRLRLRDRVRFLFLGRAYKRRFVARAAELGIVFSPTQPSHRFLFAAASFAMLSVMGWLGGQLYEARIRNQAMAADLHALRQRSGQREPQAQTALLQINQHAPEVPVGRENPDEGALQARADLEQAQAGLEQAQAGLQQARADSRDLGEQLRQAREKLESLGSEVAGSRIAETRLSDQLRESELRLTGLTSEVTRLQAVRSADTEIIASQKLHLRELTDRINTESDTIDRERKLLVADLDIRELMGARSLHIVDVFDVDGKGKTQRPFGRVFYTEGKSLIFYAFDLKGGATFQAWGQREARDESAQSLGIFYVDDQKQNRWVLKFEDPKVLAEINAVFVTVEPPGGSAKPNRQKMLYAYLNATPNHP